LIECFFHLAAVLDDKFQEHVWGFNEVLHTFLVVQLRRGRSYLAVVTAEIASISFVLSDKRMEDPIGLKISNNVTDIFGLEITLRWLMVYKVGIGINFSSI
jgi:hypothetical protein